MIEEDPDDQSYYEMGYGSSRIPVCIFLCILTNIGV